MNLEMKVRCEKCAAALQADGQAYICSHECTFCPHCALKLQNACPHCGGELVLRPRRSVPALGEESNAEEGPTENHPGLIWAISFGVWTFVSLAATAAVYEMYHMDHGGMRLGTIAGMQFSQILTYAPLTPFAFAFAVRYPIQRGNWARRTLLHLAAGLAFTLAHVALKGVTPYGYWDPGSREWSAALWDSNAHTFRAPWIVLKSMFLSSVVDDVTGAYVPVVFIAYAASYYRRFRERELRATQLEGQLAKARLQTLKSQLQPHFLFNTLHSISSLMLTDVAAADQMMTLLSDLLRMSLAGNGTQITTLSGELEFVNGYLEIEKIRFEDRLKVILDIAPDTLDAQVPHLLLQPLVENAVRHGVSRLSSGGEILIAASHDDRCLHLKIRDNGPGLAKSTDVSSQGGFGLGAARERLRTLYGNDQEIEIRNAADGGVEVNLRIPFRVDSRRSVGGDS